MERDAYSAGKFTWQPEASTEEVVSIVIRGIDLDRGANYFDSLERAQEKELKAVWKQIHRQSKKMTEEQTDLVLKFLFGMLWMSFMKAGKMEILCGDILIELVGMIMNKKRPVSDQIYGQILRDYLLDDLDPRNALPEWNSIKASAEDCQQFAQILLKGSGGENTEKYTQIRRWAESGLRYTQEQIKRKKIEEKIPKSHIADLTAIVDHYRDVEKQLREQVYQIAKMQDEIGTLYGEKSDLERQVRELTEELTATQQRLDKAEKKVRELAASNKAYNALKKTMKWHCLRILLTISGRSTMILSIPNRIKWMKNSVIYTGGKLKNIFKILRRKGIRME